MKKRNVFGVGFVLVAMLGSANAVDETASANDKEKKESVPPISKIQSTVQATVRERTSPLLPIPENRNEYFALYGIVYELAPGVAEEIESVLADFSSHKRYEVLVRYLHNELDPEKFKEVARPSTVIPLGAWSSFKIVQEFTYPSAYDPAIVPEDMVAALNEVNGGSDEKPLKWKTTKESGAFIPPFPSDLEKRELGLSARFRPRASNGGGFSIDLEIDRSVFSGFVNYGSPILMGHPGALHRKAPPMEVIPNEILMPQFKAHREKTTLSLAKGAYFFSKPGLGEKATDDTPVSTVGADFRQSGLPDQVWLIWGEKIETDIDAIHQVDATDQPSEHLVKSWPFSENLRKGFSIASDESAESQSENLAGKLKELGVSMESLEFKEDGTLEIRATQSMLDRVSGLLSVYEKRPQVFMTWKVFEMSKPVSDLDSPVMNDEEVQILIRRLNQTKAVDLLSAPSVMARPFQRAKVEVVREFIYPSSYAPPEIRYDPRKASEGEEESVASFPVTPANPVEFETRNTGINLQAEARFFEDRSIEIAFRPEIVEFEGFVNLGQPIIFLDKAPLGKYRPIHLSENRIEMPVFESRSAEGVVRIPDGASVLIGGVVKTDRQSVQDKIPILGDLPLIGRMGRSESTLELTRYQYFLVTAKLIGPAGMPITPNAEDE